MLSQSTNDRNRDVAFLRLRDALRRAGRRSATPRTTRSRRRSAPAGSRRSSRPASRRSCASSTIRPRSTTSRTLDVAAARAELVALPGVGRKTAACVLLFAYGMRDVPVDTHVCRVGTRLGLFRPGAPFEELHDDMLAITPRGQELEFHVNLLRHGRRTCHAQRPECPSCALRRMCPWPTSSPRISS